MQGQPAIFESQPIRRIYDAKTDTWWFSVVDIIKILTDQSDTRRAGTYWKVLKNRLSKEGSQVVTNCNQLKLPAEDGKERLTDCATAETLLRLVQSVPSAKAEPIKLWLAKVGYERMQELADPSRSIDRARDTYKKQGRSDKWITQRMTGQETRNKLTDYWAANDVKKGQEFAILTNVIHEEWAGVSVSEHKSLKGLRNHNLRDHMTEAELIFTALAELSTRQLAEAASAKGLEQNQNAARSGGQVAKRARLDLEEKTGRKVVSGDNYLPPPRSQKRLK